MGEMIYHQMRDPLQCVGERGHSFTGWREFECGGEKFCSRCGVGAMEYSIAQDDWKWTDDVCPRTRAALAETESRGDDANR